MISLVKGQILFDFALFELSNLSLRWSAMKVVFDDKFNSLVMILISSLVLSSCVSMEEHNRMRNVYYTEQEELKIRNKGMLTLIDNIHHKTGDLRNGNLNEKEFRSFWQYLRYSNDDVGPNLHKNLIKSYLGPPDRIYKTYAWEHNWYYYQAYYEPDSETKRTVEFVIKHDLFSPGSSIKFE